MQSAPKGALSLDFPREEFQTHFQNENSISVLLVDMI